MDPGVRQDDDHESNFNMDPGVRQDDDHEKAGIIPA
jgi:hypothetical protein